MASAVALPLAQSTYPDVAPVLTAALAEDAARGDRRLRWLVVTDVEGQVVAQTPGVDGAGRAAAEARLAEADADAGVSRAALPGSSTEWVYGAPVRLGRQVVGALRVGVSTAGLAAELAASLAAAEADAARARERLWLAGGMVVLIGVLLAGLQGIGLARPIRELRRQAERLAAGDLSQRVGDRRGDELGHLAGAFNHMADQLGTLLALEGERAALDKEMDLAREVQQAMLPAPTLATYRGYRVVGTCTPASRCGGDWWCHRPLAGGRLLLVIGDATGHGVHSAMIAATARGAVEALATSDASLGDPERVLRAIDAAICNVGDHRVLMTCFAAILEPTAGGVTLRFANAGQNFPYLLERGPAGAVAQTQVIAASGNPLGDRSLAGAIGIGTRALAAGSVLVCYSDGVVERRTAGGRLYGDRRLRTTLADARVADGAELVALRDRVIAEVEAFAEGEPADDDLTFVLCQVEPTEPGGAA
ncbi:MAG: SpoIIE family protein phosphatase [Kofleriaceae bacterium]